MALLLVTLVAVMLYVFAARLYPPPSPISAAAILVDRQYALTLYVTGAIFIIMQLALAYAVLRFRDRGQRAHFTRGNAILTLALLLLVTFLDLSLGFFGRKAWADVRIAPAAPDAIEVEVTGVQFAYTFRYPGPDGKFGRLDPSIIDASIGNPLGLDANDPIATDDVVVPVLTVPVDRPVELLLRSQDVIHNFFVRELRLQQDAVPGMVIPVHFTANRVGQYEIVCTQLCGLGHYRMHSYLNVVSDSDYEAFLLQSAAAAIPAPAAVTKQ